MSQNVDCVLFRAGRNTLAESDNTAKERRNNPELSLTAKGLNLQFQRALLEFINLFPPYCTLSSISKDEYIQAVVNRFNCNPNAIRAGMGAIHSYIS